MGTQAFKTWSSLACRHIFNFGSQFASRRPLARLLSTFLCCLAVVIRPISALGGNYAFLDLALKELVFGVQENLAQQLELTVLNIMGALLGIGFSTLAKYIASLTPEDSARSRATCAIFLVMISFFAGLAKSRLVRLQLSTRISCFVSIWILTSNIGVPSKVLKDSGYFLWVTLTPAILCLVSLLIVMSLLRWSSTSFEGEMSATFALLQRCLMLGLNRLDIGGKNVTVDTSEYLQLRSQLLQRSINLNETYSQAAFELRIGRLSLKSIRPFIGIVEHLRRELAWGMPVVQRNPNASKTPSHHNSGDPTFFELVPQTKFVPALKAPAHTLGHAVLAAMKAVEHLILVTFHQGTFAKTSQSLSASEKEAVRVAEETLISARDDAREQLGQVFDEMDLEQRAAGTQVHLPKDLLDSSLAMIALLQMTQEMRQALQVAQRIAIRYEESRLRFWYPRISLAWLGVPPGPFISDDLRATLQLAVHSGTGDPGNTGAEQHLTSTETHQGLAEQGYIRDIRRFPSGLTYSSRTSARTGIRMYVESSVPATFKALWSHPALLRARLWLAKIHRSVQHSSHLRHAMKNAIGVAILSFPAFMPLASSGRKWFTSWHGQWMVISYLWVLETNTGATWRTGYLRLFGTILGAIYAYITWLICKTNPFGLVILVTAADIPITWMITKTTLTPLAVPASVTLPPIVFAQYIMPDTTTSVLKLAIIRAVMIAIGIILALIMNGLVFPRHCRVLFLSHTSRTLGLLSHLYMTLSHDTFRMQAALAQAERRKTVKLELQIRNALYRLSALITTMHDEISLLPKPLAHYRRIVMVLQKLLDSMTGLRKIRENIPRRETVASVFKERREFMSCVCITLFACQHAFRAREPLPQFLPSPRHAFINLESHVQDSIRQAREEDAHAMGLSLVYAFAEQEVMKSMVDTLEELLDLSGRLFGTSAWLTQDLHLSIASIQEEGNHGWYSTFQWEEV
ncbi:hypothetical protein AcW2_004274 [Taiwanofungus camphoratus]|nr:hypothetical protein AcW2_004274 [Antrodia cinnamomea]